MATNVYEIPESREHTQDRVVLKFRITGSEDDGEVRAAVLAEAPDEHEGFPLARLLRLEWTGRELWEADVEYSFFEQQFQEAPTEAAPGRGFEVGTASTHITHSLQTIAGQGVGEASIPNFYQAINVDENGIGGLDIEAAAPEFTETWVYDDTAVTTLFKTTLIKMTGKVNNAPFKGFEAGEVLFRGAVGNRRADGKWEFTYRFAVSENETEITIGDLNPIDKDGWDYLWVRTIPEEDESAGAIVRSPAAVYVERVYKRANFAALGIGTT